MQGFNKIKQIFKTKELRNKIFFVLAMFAIYRLAAHIPVPTVNTASLRSFFEGNQLFGLLNLFTGGSMDNFSVAALGVGPYITSSIVIQLLTMVVPKLEQMQKEEGEDGRRKMNQITRWLTVPFAAIQAFGIISILQRSGVNIIDGNEWWVMAITILTMTAGSIFVMWIGELITEKGIGNGISLLIFAGIIAALPQATQQLIAGYDSSMLVDIIILVLLAIAVVAAIVFVNEGQRNIPVSYARRGKAAGGANSHLPLRVNQAGVMPIIFALSVMLTPSLVANFFIGNQNEIVANGAQWIVDIFQNDLFYGIVYFFLVIGFTFFYTGVTFDPEKISENIQKNGGFVPGIRPGKATKNYLQGIATRITLFGSIFLGLIAVLPFIVRQFTDFQALEIGGTGILIVVAVVIETVKQIEAQLVMRDYESFY